MLSWRVGHKERIMCLGTFLAFLPYFGGASRSELYHAVFVFPLDGDGLAGFIHLCLSLRYLTYVCMYELSSERKFAFSWKFETCMLSKRIEELKLFDFFYKNV